MKKAKYIESYIFQGRKYGEYEYLGRKYDVCFEWNAEPLNWQHENQQRLIERDLEILKRSREHTSKNSPAQEGIDLFWRYINGEDISLD